MIPFHVLWIVWTSSVNRGPTTGGAVRGFDAYARRIALSSAFAIERSLKERSRFKDASSVDSSGSQDGIGGCDFEEKHSDLSLFVNR